VFGFWDWVGGRFSVCSAVGVLPLSLQYGFPIVEQFLNGAHDMDTVIPELCFTSMSYSNILTSEFYLAFLFAALFRGASAWKSASLARPDWNLEQFVLGIQLQSNSSMFGFHFIGLCIID
jgi:hypothetical protein